MHKVSLYPDETDITFYGNLNWKRQHFKMLSLQLVNMTTHKLDYFTKTVIIFFLLAVFV